MQTKHIRLNAEGDMTEIDSLINYGIKEGVIDDSASDWTPEQKQSYFNVCNAYEPDTI